MNKGVQSIIASINVVKNLTAEVAPKAMNLVVAQSDKGVVWFGFKPDFKSPLPQHKAGFLSINPRTNRPWRPTDQPKAGDTVVSMGTMRLNPILIDVDDDYVDEVRISVTRVKRNGAAVSAPMVNSTVEF